MTDQTPYAPTIEQFLGFANSALIASGMPEEEAFQTTERVLAAHDAQVRAEALREAANVAEDWVAAMRSHVRANIITAVCLILIGLALIAIYHGPGGPR